MNIKKSYLIIWSLSVLLGLVAIPNHAGAEEIVLKVSSHVPPKHRMIEDVYLLYFKEVEKRTNGQVKFKFFPGATLAKAHQTRDAVTSGLVDIVMPMAVWTMVRQYPVSRILQFPFIMDSSRHGAFTYYKAFHAIPEIRKEYEDVKVLGFHTTGVLDLGTTRKKAPKSLAEMKGLTVWAASPIAIEMAKVLGMTPRTVKVEDLYMSLQRGSLDAALFPIAPARSYKLIDVIRSWTMFSTLAGLQPIVMNLKTWNSLPKNVQKVFDDLSLSLSALNGACVTNEAQWVAEELKKRGDSFYYVTAEEKMKYRKMLEPQFDEWVAEMNAKGIDGRAILDKVLVLSEETRKNPYKEPDGWWGRAGRLK